jgi:3-deoxy-D-manno-octulosonate 8-phosphate phosphatase KdsC-like HAD superfamily phosphatase
MEEILSIIKNNKIELLVWDFDGVIYDLDWNYNETPEEFLKNLYSAINEIDKNIISDKKVCFSSVSISRNK